MPSDYPAPVRDGKYCPYAKLTPDYSAGYGPSCPDCDEPFQWHGGPVAIREDVTDRLLATACRDCCEGYAKRPGARWETRGLAIRPTTVVIP